MRLDTAGFGASCLLFEAVAEHGREDVHALAHILSHRCSGPHAPYRQALGLAPAELATVVERWFPGIAALWTPGTCLAGLLAQSAAGEHVCPASGDTADPGYGRFSRSLQQQEEADLCRLFLDHRSDDGVWPVLFARLLARACMESDHLWICLGLRERDQLTGILERRFPALAARNHANMRWKRFFYKLLCDSEKVWACSATTCAVCAHHAECYVGEG